MKLILTLVLLLSFSITTTAENTQGVNIADNSITLALSQEPRTLNSLNAESVSYTAQLMVHLQEGLMRYNKRRRLVGGVAERWQISDKEMRFWIRKDAKWQNGKPVTASDFVFAWQQLVKPNTGSPSANLASPILNAAEIIRGELPATALGVEAVNSNELLVRLAHPCAWCLKLMTSSIFYPLNQKFYEQHQDNYGTSKESHLANGAFQIDTWQRGKEIQLIKNKKYWRQKEVSLDAINFNYIGSDAKTRLNLFRSGEIAVASLDRETMPSALDLGYRLKSYPTGHLFHIQFSHLKGMLSANVDLRKAIALVIDKDEIINRVVASPGTSRADSMFHDWLTVADTRYLQARPAKRQEVDVVAAKKHLEKAKQTLGLHGPIKLSLTINDSNLYRRIAEYLQQSLKKNLDIDLAIDPQITQMMVQKWRLGVSDMTLITWPVDVDDPMDQISFMGNPDFRKVFKGLYAGDDMAALYVRNRNATKLSDRLDAIQAVQTLFEDKVTVLPLFESYGAALVSKKLKGYVWQPVRGYGDYRYARIQ